MRPAALAAVCLCALALLVVPSASSSRPDPCAKAHHDTCSTVGVGYYRHYRFGTRWFGDFHGAVPGAVHTFCIDLGYWFPNPKYRYREQHGPLRNRDRELVSAERRQRMAYAAWT